MPDLFRHPPGGLADAMVEARKAMPEPLGGCRDKPGMTTGMAVITLCTTCLPGMSGFGIYRSANASLPEGGCETRDVHTSRRTGVGSGG